MSLRLAFLSLFAAAPLTQATTVVPPSFAELVGEAETIFRGRVTAVQARRVERPDAPGVLLKTFVTFVVERTLKGHAAAEVTLEFLGGTVGPDRLVVSGMPVFRAGDREIVFVQKNGLQFCPLVAMRHGRYRVLHDQATDRDYVARDNHRPLTDLAEVAIPPDALPAPLRAASAASASARAFNPAAFESSIAAEVNRPSRPATLE